MNMYHLTLNAPSSYVKNNTFAILCISYIFVDFHKTKHKLIIMETTTRIRNKKKFVINFLQDLRDNGELSVPIHRLNLDEWFNLFESKTSHISNDVRIFSDKRFFSLQMNNIAEMNLFETLTKKEQKYPIYEVYFEVFTEEPQTHQYFEDFDDDTSSQSSDDNHDDGDDDGKCMKYLQLVLRDYLFTIYSYIKR